MGAASSAVLGEDMTPEDDGSRRAGDVAIIKESGLATSKVELEVVSASAEGDLRIQAYRA